MPWAFLDGGRDHRVSLTSYRPPKLGSPQPIRCWSVTLACLSGCKRIGQKPKSKRNLVPSNNQRRKTTLIRIGTWNVRTLCTGIGQDLTEVDNIRKTAVVDRELTRLKVDIAALQETRLPNSGSIKERNYTFFWQGLNENRRLHGVGFAVHNRLLDSITTPVAVSERIISLKLRTRTGQATVISAYAPTLSADQETKTQFYEEINYVVQQIPAEDQLFVLGDFNARVGADHELWPTCLGHFGVGKMNENGQRLLELCANNQLCVTNTYFNCKPRYRVSWRHPRSSHWHQLDIVLTKRGNINSVNMTRSFPSADCDTDHTLVICKAKIEWKKLHSAKPPKKPKLCTVNMRDPLKRENFREKLEDRLEQRHSSASPTDQHPDQTWEELRTAMYDAAMESFGKKYSVREDWMEEYSDILLPLLDEKKAALVAHDKSPTQATRDRLREAKRKLQRESRKCANEYWNKLCHDIQEASEKGDIKTMYQKIKVALGPQVSKVAPIKSKSGELIHDKNQQLNRWVEHYSDLYSAEHHLDETLQLPSLPELTDLDAEPSIAELSGAIDDLSTGKAPGSDAIPAELLKTNKDALLPRLHQLLIQCWREGTVPHDMRTANIVTMYKNKGDKGDCNNYRGISLLSTTGKAFARVILNRLQRLADRVLPESQCGFRSERATIDMIFSIRQLQEKCREQQKPLFIAFVDLTKAFDTVSRSGLFQVLKAIGCPPYLLRLITSFHEDMQATVQYDGSQSDSFAVRSGVRQGCVLAPTLFGIYFAVLLQIAFTNSPGDVFLHWRTDGSLFNLTRFRAKTKVKQATIRDLLFADDAALVAHNQHTLQEMIDSLNETCKAFSLVISMKKTVVLTQGLHTAAGDVNLDGKPLEMVQKFCYLGSIVSSSATLDDEINCRIGKAATTFGKLTKRAWQNKHLTTRTKTRIYESCVLSTLLYASETWTTYKGQEKKLNIFHLRCLRKLLNIKWQDRVPNSRVLERAGLTSIMTILSKRRMRWLGHVRRMDNNRIPKQFLFGELVSGHRPQGRPKLRFHDVCKDTMKHLQIDHKTWEWTASDRVTWRTVIHTGAVRQEKELRSEWEANRRRRREKVNQTNPTQDVFICRFCSRQCRSNIGRISHERSCSTRL